MKRIIDIRPIIIRCVSVLLFMITVSLETFSQINFFTNVEDDSLATNFYQRNKKATILVCSTIPSLQVGGVLFLHNADNRASYYFEMKTNGNRRYVITGSECGGDGVRQKEVAYTTSSVSVGLSRGFTKNWFIYGAVGVVVKNTHYDNQIEDNYRFPVPNEGLWFNIAGGTLYVADNNLSFLIGMDFYDRGVTLGLGYSL